MLVFAPQNLIADPPFTKLDLLSCRNLLIYLDAPLQKRLFPLFHYALTPGRAPVPRHVGDGRGRSRTCSIRRQEVEDLPPPGGAGGELRRRDFPAALPAIVGPGDAASRRPTAAGTLARRSARTERAAPGAGRRRPCSIHERGDIVHIHGRTGRVPRAGARAAGGAPTSSTWRARGSQLEPRGRRSARRPRADDEVVHRGVRVAAERREHPRSISACAGSTDPEPLRGLFLVTFERCRAAPATARRGRRCARARPSVDARPDRASSSASSSTSKESHQSTIEELETANEELKSTNEELQSTNEELQSANEELETSKEEMQSLNEELQTVNAELQGKVEELSRANDDMKNLLNGTDIATIFLDGELNIKRFTEQAKRVIRLIPSDVGRPIGDLVLEAPLRQPGRGRARGAAHARVQGDRGPRRGTAPGTSMRILPYRTTDNVIDGLVLTFVDITRIRTLQEGERRLLEALKRSSTTVFGQDLELRFVWSWSSVFGRKLKELVGKTDADLLPADQAKALGEIKRGVIASGAAIRRRVTLTPRREDRIYDLYVEPMRAEEGEVVGVSCVLTDITSLDSEP